MVALRAQHEFLLAELSRLGIALSPTTPPSLVARPSASQLEAVFAGLTLKQRAFLLAKFAGHTFAAMSRATGLDESTIKAAVRAGSVRLGITGSRSFKTHGPSLLASLGPDIETRFGVDPDWMHTRPPALMATLRRKKQSPLPPPGGGRNKAVPSP